MIATRRVSANRGRVCLAVERQRLLLAIHASTRRTAFGVAITFTTLVV